ncbi:MAG: DNA-binding response regulator [Proteobacteria bacterium]|jgi:DNA-binding NarL/FixJ family response regulator|nr:DNA-binding response regulator [Pseudomonadota bacterium]MBS1171286.1 DNA-binding response regulator [Pseudomonadota bacterium]
MSSVRVLLVDDHALVRAGLNLLLEHMPGIFVSEAGSGEEALEVLRSERVGLVLTDVAMKGMTGLELAERIRHEFPHVRVMILSMYDNEEYVLQALRAGASAYLLKESAPKELEVAINAVLAGETYLSPPISRQVVDSYIARTGSGQKPAHLLTPRQREILVLIGEGCSTRDIAQRLGLSVKTVETHRAQLMDRLDIHDLAGLVRYAVRVGLVSADK